MSDHNLRQQAAAAGRAELVRQLREELNMKFIDIGGALGISRSRVRQIYDRQRKVLQIAHSEGRHCAAPRVGCPECD